MSEYRHGWWHSADGLRLHYREYPGSGEANRPVVLCLPGLTRNARDFAELAGRISSPSGGGWRVICAEMRGRGMVDGRDGLLLHRTFAAYSHIHALGAPHWAPNFVRAALAYREGR